MNKRYWGLILLFISAISYTQELVHYKVDHFTPKAGLSSIYGRKIIQDPYDFMWVGTADGLNRYNGKTFSVYNKDIGGKQSLTGSDIRDLLIDTLSTSLWAVNSYGGIDQINYVTGNIVFQYYQNYDPQTKDILLNSLALYKRRLFVGGSGGLFVLDPETKKISKVKLIAATPVNDLLTDGAGRLWVFCENKGVCVLDIDKQTVVAKYNCRFAPPGIVYYDVCPLTDSTVIAATNTGLFVYSMNSHGGLRMDANDQPGSLLRQGAEVYACRVDRLGKIWCSQSGQLIRIDPRRRTASIVKETISRPEPGWLNSVYSIYFDRANHLWLGCQQGLAYSTVQPAPFRQFTASAVSETRIGHAYYLFPFNDSVLYSCAQDGLYAINTITSEIKPVAEKKPFYHFFVDPTGKKLAGNIDGTFVLINNKLVPIDHVYPAFRSLGKIVINSHCQIGDSMLVMGTENFRGIILWNYRTNKVTCINDATPNNGLKENTINGLFKDDKDRLWVLGDHSVSLLNVRSGAMRWLLPEDAIKHKYFSIFFDVCQVKNKFYIASYGAGVLVLDSSLQFEKQLAVADGLSANSVYKILPWRDSLLFVSSNNGISQLRLTPSLQITKYFESDGLHGNVFEENSGALFNRFIFTGGEGGVTRIEPSLLPKEPSPGRLFIDQIRIKTNAGQLDTCNLLIKNIAVPNNVLQTTVYFSYTNFTNSERNQFAYRIKELGNDWVQLGGQNFANLIGLAPGTYHLEIKATAENNLGNSAITAIALVFLPKWYQTAWFKGFILLSITALFYTLYRYRLAQLKKQAQIRKDIASDLHDDIGSTLNSVRIFTHLAKREPEKNEHLSRIEESLTQASMGLRDMIWVLDDAGDTVYDVMERIKRYAVPVCQVKQIQFESFVHSDDSGDTLSKTEKRNLLLIAKEAINNSIKYAECREIQVTIKQHGKFISLIVKDDGSGFDANTIQDGHGLKNIEHRAKQINAIANITASKAGTVLMVTRE